MIEFYCAGQTGPYGPPGVAGASGLNGAAGSPGRQCFCVCQNDVDGPLIIVPLASKSNKDLWHLYHSKVLVKFACKCVVMNSEYVDFTLLVPYNLESHN